MEEIIVTCALGQLVLGILAGRLAALQCLGFWVLGAGLVAWGGGMEWYSGRNRNLSRTIGIVGCVSFTCGYLLSYMKVVVGGSYVL